MKNLKTYEQFLFEESPIYAFDGGELKVGRSVISFDGYSGIIVSKEIVNGKVQYRDHKGVIRVCESTEITTDEFLNEAELTWWEVTKGILAADAIKAGSGIAGVIVGGGVIAAAHIFSNWNRTIASKIEDVRKKDNYNWLKNEASKIADKFNGDSELADKLRELQNHPHVDTTFLTGKRELKKAKEGNETRRTLMREIAKYIKSKLTEDEKKYFVEINSILKDKPLTDEEGKKIEEDVMSDTNRTVGTGTYTPTHSDSNFMVSQPHDNGDASSGGDTFFR